MASAHPSSMRVLIRPPISTTAHPPLPPPSSSTLSPNPPPLRPDQPTLPPLPSSSTAAPLSRPQSPSPPNGVVVVGFIGRRHGDVTQLINRIIDDNVFGTGRRDTNFCVDNWEELKGWFRSRKISYYHDEEKGILHLQFSGCPAREEEEVILESSSSSSSSRFDSGPEDCEFGDLQGMLFMFSVCHIIIFIQEGSSLDTHILKKFRILQAAKHLMVPSVTAQNAPPPTSKSHYSSSTRPYASGMSSSTRSLGRNGGILNHNASSISLKSGLGSFTSMLPGQCTPVILFVFIDDFSEFSGSGTESVETSSMNHSSSLSNSARANLPTKGVGPVVVLARPVTKSEGGLRKKLQSSLEAQIRFSVKKCRILTGSEISHASSRNGGISNAAPLFALDASKAIALLDISSNQRGESLDFATALVEDVLNGKATSDSLLLENHSQSANKEDIQFVKEFIYRQADILRGRGGLVGCTNTGSAGMVAVAAAAAAASAASGKTLATPDLPDMGIWSSSSQLILQSILSVKNKVIVEPENGRGKPNEKNSVPMPAEAIDQTAADPLEAVVSCLENGKELNSKFSTLWCQKSLPAAKEVYLNELPDCYPTLKHEAHLEKALRAFRLLVKGSAVNHFVKMLEEECTTIWTSGRQLCDAVSLTGKPCMHQRHDVEIDGKISKDVITPHSSGYVFLQACACGRSRSLISDPFDFSSANLTSNSFADCDKLLPALQLPQVENIGPIQSSSWSLIRVGGARYYEPSKGLLQSGFSTTQKYLLKWSFFLERPIEQMGSLGSAVQQHSTIGCNTATINESISCTNVKKYSDSHIKTQELLSGTKIQKQSTSENQSDSKVSFGTSVSNFALRKPFSEVVAGSATGISSFPPLQSRQQPSSRLEKHIKQNSPGYKEAESPVFQGSQKSVGVSSVQGGDENGIAANGFSEGDPFLQIGSNIIQVNMKKVETVKSSSSLKQADLYVGFEHECPCGHRFILTPEHLNELGSSYALLEESHTLPSLDRKDIKNIDPSKLGKSGSHGKSHRKSNGMGSVRKLRNLDKKKDVAANDLRYIDGNSQFPRVGKEQDQSNITKSKISDSLNDVVESLQSVSLDNGAYSLLNRNLPIYMNCPHCRIKNKDSPKIKFAGTVSQLQRIFLVTPPFPVTLATCPIIQFEPSCLPLSVPDREQKVQFSFGSPVILPPESFLSLRLPFVYGVQLEDGTLQSLKPFEHQPERTAWIAKGTTLQVMSREGVYTRDNIPKQT